MHGLIFETSIYWQDQPGFFVAQALHGRLAPQVAKPSLGLLQGEARSPLINNQRGCTTKADAKEGGTGKKKGDKDIEALGEGAKVCLA